MTVVRVNAKVPVDGALAPARGFLWWSPTARRVVPAGGGEPATIILPAQIKAPLVAGAVDITVEPTTNAWVWCVLEAFTGFPSRRRYFAVPTAASVDYADLVEIDLASLAPVATADPAWLEPFETLSAGTVTPDPANPGFYLIGA